MAEGDLHDLTERGEACECRCLVPSAYRGAVTGAQLTHAVRTL